MCILLQVPEEKREVAVSPVLLMKARKSEEESQGMKNAHLRDAVAVCDFLAFMEREVCLSSLGTTVQYLQR